MKDSLRSLGDMTYAMEVYALDVRVQCAHGARVARLDGGGSRLALPHASTGTGQLQLEHLDLLQLRSCRRRQQLLLALRRRERRCSSRPLAARRLELLLQPPLTGAPYRRRRRWRLSRRSRRSERSQPAHLVRISPRIWPPGSRTLGRAERLQWRATRAARVGSRAAARGEGGEGAGAAAALARSYPVDGDFSESAKVLGRSCHSNARSIMMSKHPPNPLKHSVLHVNSKLVTFVHH